MLQTRLIRSLLTIFIYACTFNGGTSAIASTASKEIPQLLVAKDEHDHENVEKISTTQVQNEGHHPASDDHHDHGHSEKTGTDPGMCTESCTDDKQMGGHSQEMPAAHGEVKSEPAPGMMSHSAMPMHDQSSAEKSQPTPKSSEHAASENHATAHHAASTGVTSEQSLQWLKNGNKRFTSRHFRADGRSGKDRKRLLAGQKPHAIVLSCADSRVPPEIVFDQMLGEVFVIRVAGEALDSSVIASVEYAVEHLGSHLLVVMGHTQCGAVTAAIATPDGTSAGSESLDRLIADIKPRLKTLNTEKPSPHLEIESTVNADGVARDLVKRSEIIRKKVESGELVIKPALYRMDSGSVTFY